MGRWASTTKKFRIDCSNPFLMQPDHYNTDRKKVLATCMACIDSHAEPFACTVLEGGRPELLDNYDFFCQNSLQVNSEAGKPEGVEISWDECDKNAVISHYLIQITIDQIQRIWQSCHSEKVPANRQNAITVHVWAVINRARSLQGDDDDEKLVHCDFTLGLRNRLSPPLGKLITLPSPPLHLLIWIMMLGTEAECHPKRTHERALQFGDGITRGPNRGITPCVRRLKVVSQFS